MSTFAIVNLLVKKILETWLYIMYKYDLNLMHQIEEFQVSYGPRMIVRSIKRINKGEEVTMAYTDLLQHKVLFKQR